MGLKGKLEAEIKIKSSADLFHALIGSEREQLSDASSKLDSVVLIEGEAGKPGSVIRSKYFLDGKERAVKERLEAIDEKDMKVTYQVIEGYPLEESDDCGTKKNFNSFFITVHVIPKGEHNLVKWTFVYEKTSRDAPYPTKLMDFGIDVTKDIEATHLNA